jgi:predicted ferric reductase
VSTDWESGPIEAVEDLTGWRARERTRSRARPRSTKPTRFWARLFAALAWIGAVCSVALVVPVTTSHDLAAPGGLATVIGRVTGLAGTFMMLITILLIGRIPAVERALGQDTLVRWHRRLGPWIIILLVAHGLFITLGYAQGLRTGLAHEIATLVTHFPGMLGAVVGLSLLVLAGATSYRNVRRKMRYETWWTVHLYTYLAAAVSFTHQLTTGAPFLSHPLARAYWISLWLLTAGVVLSYRVALPVLRSLGHKLRVARVEEEAPGVVSVVVRGRRLDRLPVDGGQFLHWRFLKSGMWWQGHPYSLSSLPTANEMRITVKAAGDHSAALARLEPGTPVAIEGPYGAFTHHARKTDRVLLVGAGVGATPIRAMLDDLPWHVDVVAILRGSRERELILRDEIARLVSERGGRLHEVVGPRSQAPLDADHLRRLVPDIAERDLYVCGPGGFMENLIAHARALGVPESRIHHEDFAF